jgi:hypothetical protein
MGAARGSSRNVRHADARCPLNFNLSRACTFHIDCFHSVAQADARRPSSFAAKRRASAIDVRVGLEQPEVGKTAFPTI